jgi:hypothetical protein
MGEVNYINGSCNRFEKVVVKCDIVSEIQTKLG